MFIDTHVHGRDGNQAYKETIAHLLSVAERTGFSAVASVGNGNPPTINEEAFLFYQDRATQAKSKVIFYQWILLTEDTNQLEQAVELWHKYPEVIGFKLFPCHSVGDTKVDTRKGQRKVFEVLAKNNYQGVLMIHCEKEDFIVKCFDPKFGAISHCYNRPPIAEIASVSDMLGDALEYEFNGKIHIAHVSCPESIEMKLRHPLKERISAGVGPQHIVMNEKNMLDKNGLLRKKNPPLRDENRMHQMRDYLQRGLIEIYESDHAPHTRKEKENHPYISGFPQLPIVPLYVNFLKRELRMTDEQILDHMFYNAKKLFAPKLDNVQPRPDVSLNDLSDLIKNVPTLRREYDYDAWEGIFN